LDRLLGNELAFAGVSPSAVNKVSKKTVVYKSLFKNSGINISWSSVSKPKFIDETLRKFANQLYRDGAVIGNGSTADAIRYIKKQVSWLVILIMCKKELTQWGF